MKKEERIRYIINSMIDNPKFRSNLVNLFTEFVKEAFTWPSDGNISEFTLLSGIDCGSFNTDLVGRTVTLKEGDITHDWTIIRVNEDSYDLWYNGTIGTANWEGKGNGRYWYNQDIEKPGNIRYLCNEYKSKLSEGVQSFLKPGLLINSDEDTVVVLSAKQLGSTSEDLPTTIDEVIPYFANTDSNNPNRNLNFTYWTSTHFRHETYRLWAVKPNNSFYCYDYNTDYNVVPAIRLGI